ncbi:MAG: glycosyltransferase family 39 protein [Elusimicrobia bacterium]|nr:glycosyltransferase family 39 protein [Elusimicrobiota bacterium]
MIRKVVDRRGLCLAIVAFFSLLVHAKGLAAPLLDYHFHRQVNTASIARRYWSEALPIHQPRVDWNGPSDRLAATELPVYMWLHGKLWPVAGLGEKWGRILSAAASLLSALLLFILFEKEFDREAALWGASLFSILPVEVYFGRTVQPEATALLALIGSLWFWSRSLEPGRPWGAWAGAVFCAFIAVGLKLPYAHLLVPLAGLAWRRLGRRAFSDWRMYAAGLLSMGGVIAWYLHARRGVYVVPTHADEYTSLLDYSRLPYFIQFQVLSRFPELVMTYGGLVFFAVGARRILWEKRDAFWLSWFFGVVLHLFAMAGYSHSHEYTALPLAPVAAGLIGVGVARLRGKAAAAPPRRRALAFSGLALLVLAIPAHSALRISHWYRQGFEFVAGAGKAAAAVSAGDDPFLTNCQASSVLLYYLNRRGWSGELDLLPAAAAHEYVDEHIGKGARFIASEKRGLFAEPDGAMWKRFRAAGAPVWDDGKLVIFPLTR